MPLPADFDNLDSLDPNSPQPDEPVNQGDDWIRGLQNALWGNITGDATETRLLTAGLVTLKTQADGARVLGEVAGSSVLTLADSADADQAKLESGATGDLGLENSVEGQAVSLLATNGGAPEPVLVGKAGAETSLFHNAIQRIVTAVAGFAGLGTAFDFGQQTDSSIVHRIANLIGSKITRVSSGDAAVSLEQGDAAGVFEQTWIKMNRGGIVQLFANGVSRLESATNGGKSIGPQFNVDNQSANSDTSMRVRNQIGGMALKVAATNALMSIEQTQPSGGFERPILDAFRDGRIAFYFDTNITLQTATYGAQTVGQHRISEAAPANVADATRKDYVDTRTSAAVGVVDRRYNLNLGQDGTSGVSVESALISTGAAVSGSVVFNTPFRAGSVPNVLLTQEGGQTATDENAVVTAVSNTGFNWSLATGGGDLTYLAIGQRA